MAAGRRRNRPEEGGNGNNNALEYLNGLARNTRGRARTGINQLIGDLRNGMQEGRPVDELFARLQQAQADGVIRNRDLADAQIQLNNEYRPQAPRGRGERRRGRIIMPDEMDEILGRRRQRAPQEPDEAEEDEEGDEPGEEDADAPADADADEEREERPAERPARRNRAEGRRPARVPIRNPEEPAEEVEDEARPARARRPDVAAADEEEGDEEPNELARLRALVEDLQRQVRELLAERRGGAGEPAAPAAPAAPAVPDDFQDRLNQLNQNLAAIPEQPVAAPGVAAAPDRAPAPADQAAPAAPEAPAQPPTPPAVRDEWPNWPEIQQAPPHPEYLNFLQQLLCQLQAQGINLQPDARLQNAINRMLHARDAHLAGLRGWDAAHGAFANAGLQGPDRVAAGNAFLMRQNYWGTFEAAMDQFKVELFRFIIAYKRQAFGPQANPEQLRIWARQEGRQIAINCIYPVALTMYEDMERRAAMSLQETRDRNIFQRIGDWWNRQPRWGRILMGAGIAAGIGGLVGAFVGPGLALSYAAFRGARALAGGAMAFTVQSAVDSWFVSPHYQRQRQQATEHGRAGAMQNIERLASGWEAQGLDWYMRYGNLSELMRTIDRDALLHLQELNRIGQREGRTRLVTGLLTGLAGGLAGGALYDHWAHPAGAVAMVPPGGPKAPLPPETGHGDVVRTIKPGDNLWKVSRGLIGDHTITKDQWSDAWQHSNVKVMSHGVEKTVPISTVGLIHPNDQFIIHHTPDGHVRFDVVDYSKDKLHLGDNAEYARLLQEHGKPLPQWLRQSLGMHDYGTSHTTPVGGVHHGIPHHGAGNAIETAVTTTPTPDNIVNFPRASMSDQIVIDNPGPLMKSFPTESLADQNKIINQLNRQITDLRTELKDPNLPPAFQAHDQELLNKALELQRDLQGIHDVSLEHFQIAFTSELDNRHIPWKFYDGIKDVRVGDYLWMTDQMHQGGGVAPGGKIAILGALTDNKDASYSLEKFIKEFNPGRFEKKMTLDAFFKHVPPTESYSKAA